MKTVNGATTYSHPYNVARQAVRRLQGADAFRFETDKTHALFFRNHPNSKMVSVTDGVELELFMNPDEMLGMIAGMVLCSAIVEFKTVPLEDVPDV